LAQNHKANAEQNDEVTYDDNNEMVRYNFIKKNSDQADQKSETENCDENERRQQVVEHLSGRVSLLVVVFNELRAAVFAVFQRLVD